MIPIILVHTSLYCKQHPPSCARLRNTGDGARQGRAIVLCFSLGILDKKTGGSFEGRDTPEAIKTTARQLQ
jgi:hypothetical protein